MSESRAAKLARIAGWPKDDWEFGGNGRDTWAFPLVSGHGRSYGGRLHRERLDPEHCLDHAMALAECRWPGGEYDIKLERVGIRWYFFAKRRHPIMTGPYLWDSSAIKKPCDAICDAIEESDQKRRGLA